MKEIFIDINDYNKSFITATENDNNSDIYKIIITEDARRFDLTGKTVQMAYAISYTDKGDILNLNVTNPTEGEITLEITNELTRKDGDYTCQLLILGENEYRRHSKYYFNLSIRENLFNKISGEIIESPNLGILQELIKKAEFLNTQLENNINLAETLNTNLNENISVADPLNNSLSEKIPEAATRKTELENSINKAKEFIDGLDGSQNIPQIRMDVTELQNGLKSNQALSYEGSSISANDTLEGRTEGMRIGGRTLNNLLIPKKANLQGGWVLQDDNIFNVESNGNGFADIRFNDLPIKPNTNYTCYIEILENTLVGEGGISVFGFNEFGNGTSIPYNSKGLVQVKSLSSNKNGFYFGFYKNSITSGCLKLRLMLIEGNNNNTINYFEGLKSFGETEKVGDKYKISILSSGKNLTNCKFELGIWNVSPTDQEPNKQSNSNYVRSSELIDISKFNDQQISISLNGKSVEGNIKYYTKDRKYIKDVFNAPFNPVPNAFYITIHVPLSRFSKYDEFQIETGSNSTSYEPYKCDKKDILIKEPLKEREYIYEDNGQVKVYRPTKQYTFTGNETSIIKWATVKDENFIGFCITNDDIPNLTSKRSLVVCNNFPSVDGVITKRNMYIAANSVNICIEKSALATPDIEGFRAWLKANPTTIVYQLAAPTVEIVENCVDIDLDTFQEKTYFNILNSLPGSLDFKVPSNIASIVQNTAREVNNIWDVINNLLVPGLMDTKKTLALKTIKNNLK